MEPINDPWMKNGGPAFPAEDGYGGHYRGASLRDYFAAKAITGCLPGKAHHDLEVEELARWAYRMADALLKAREE